MRMYSKFSGILFLLGGFMLGVCRSHARSHSAVSVSVFCPWILSRYKNRARLLAATCIRPHPPRSLGHCNVDIGNLKISPCHMYHAIAVFSWHTHASGGGKICDVYHAFASKKLCVYWIR
jgi:hypothetical protein